MTIYQGLGQNVTVIFPADRTPDGTYEIPAGWRHIHPFTVEPNGALEVPLMQMPLGQSFAIRARVSKNPDDPAEFFRFHPSTGGIAHIFYDENIDPAPTGTTSPIQQNKFNGMPYQFRAIQVPFEPGLYHYHVINLENRLLNYKIGFTKTGTTESDDGPCAPFN